MRKSLGAFVAWLALAAAASATPSTGAELHALCSAYLLDPQSEGASACETYVRGFLDGLRAGAADTNRPPPTETAPESWSERAVRTRLGRGALSRVRERDICLPESATAFAVIPLVVRLLQADPSRREASAGTSMTDSLRLHYACP